MVPLFYALLLPQIMYGASEPPALAAAKPNAEPARKATENQAKPEPDRRATAAQPAVVELLKAPIIRVETTDKTEKHRDYWDHEWWLVYLTAALASVTLALALYTAKLYRYTKKLALDAEAVGNRSANLSMDASHAYRIAERAYVKMSHRAPGIEFISTADGDTKAVLARTSLEIRNFGNTPAKVTRTYARFVIASKDEVASPVPDYREGENKLPFGEAFLVTNEFFSAAFESLLRNIDVEKLGNSAWRIHVLGYVDYIDIFGKHHRGGYARVFAREIDVIAEKAGAWDKRNNLVLVNFDGYNYDRERDEQNSAENHDWPKQA